MKNVFFALSQATNQHSFTLYSQFLYELKHMVHLSKAVCGVFHFSFCLAFMELYTFA